MNPAGNPGPSATDQPFPWSRKDFGNVSALRGTPPGPAFRTLTVAGEPLWIITRYDEVKHLLAHPGLSADPHRSGFPLLGQFLPADYAAPFMRTDAPEHSAFRSAIARHFTLRAGQAMRPIIHDVAATLIEAMLARPGRRADLVNDFAIPLSMQVILRLLGLPEQDWRQLGDLATRHMCAQPLTDRRQLRTSLGTGQALTNYLRAAIAARRRLSSWPDDVLSTMLTAADAGQLDPAAIPANLFLLVIAGHDTSAGMITGTVQALLDEPELIQALRHHPDRIPVAVEEALRQLSIVHQMTLRAATADIEVDGGTIRAEEGVALMLYSANHDSARFAHPDKLDLDRDPGGHLAFGHGVHRCIGQTLARVELEVSLRLLLERLPQLRITSAPDQLRYKPTSPIQGLQSLPVTL